MKKFAISNLAFGEHALPHTLRFLQDNQIEGLEIAPTLIWKEPENVSKGEIKNFKNLLSEYGLSVVALQSLLYSKANLNLFKDSRTRETLLEYLKK